MDMAALTEPVNGMWCLLLCGPNLLSAVCVLHTRASFSLGQQAELDLLRHPVQVRPSEGHQMDQEQSQDDKFFAQASSACLLASFPHSFRSDNDSPLHPITCSASQFTTP